MGGGLFCNLAGEAAGEGFGAGCARPNYVGTV